MALECDHVCWGLNSHGFHVGGWSSNLKVGVYIPIVRIPWLTVGWPSPTSSNEKNNKDNGKNNGTTKCKYVETEKNEVQVQVHRTNKNNETEHNGTLQRGKHF